MERVIAEGEHAYPRILDNLPDMMRWRDDAGVSHPTNLVLAGGELLIDGVRERLFYPLLKAIADRWGADGPRIAIQTTGDILTDDMVAAMLQRGVNSIAIASIDDYHVGHAGQGKFDLMARVRAMMARHGVAEIDLGPARDKPVSDGAPPRPRPRRADGPSFVFFGAQPDLWVGELWPRGRAWINGLSNADYGTNFCKR
ncbi:MAG: radical SAM protein, partial [Sphingomonas sp.]|nr:radical SAM protein [Sphingomonas sp.]